jgi:histidinol-phosphate aminotransferase
MKINTNLSYLQSYTTEIINTNIKRSNANESHCTILPIETLTKNITEHLNYYPELAYKNLTEVSAQFYKINQDFIIPTNGSDEGLDLIIRSFCNPGEKIVILNPTFSMYKQYAIAFGLEVIEFDLNQDFNLNIDSFINFCQQHKPKLVFIPNPLAPSGGVTKRDGLTKIIKNLPQTFIVIDEAYIEFSNQISTVNIVLENKNLVVTRTLSKFYGLAGIRLGFVFTAYKDQIMKVKSPYNVNHLSCCIAINLFKNLTDDIITQRYNQNLDNKLNLTEWLTLINEKFNCVNKIYPSEANFLFLGLNCNSTEFAKILFEQFNIKIKTFSGKFSNFARIS